MCVERVNLIRSKHLNVTFAVKYVFIFHSRLIIQAVVSAGPEEDSCHIRLIPAARNLRINVNFPASREKGLH